MGKTKLKPIPEIIEELRRPFHPDLVNWRIQTPKKDGTAALVVAYIDARDAIERLNKVCPTQWSDRMSIVMGPKEAGMPDSLLGVECTITIRDADVSLSRMDVGIGDSLDDVNIGIKTHYSDAFKRAGVKWGMATSLYDLPQIWLNEDKLYKQGDKIRGLNKNGEAELKDRYEKWVVKPYVKETYGNIF